MCHKRDYRIYHQDVRNTCAFLVIVHLGKKNCPGLCERYVVIRARAHIKMWIRPLWGGFDILIERS